VNKINDHISLSINVPFIAQEFVILMKRKTADNETEGNDDIEEAFKVFDRNGDG
jgi:Ca2+-binding EF-hand superfamily protein